jgi:hypothetical protein
MCVYGWNCIVHVFYQKQKKIQVKF